MKKAILILFLILPLSASAATYVQRAAATIDALIDGTSTGAQQTRIADAFVRTYGGRYGSTNPADYTNEQKAQVFVETMKAHGQQILQAGKQLEIEAANEATVEAAAGDL